MLVKLVDLIKLVANKVNGATMDVMERLEARRVMNVLQVTANTNPFVLKFGGLACNNLIMIFARVTACGPSLRLLNIVC